MPRPSPIERLRALCLSLPEATEKQAWGTPTFRVKEKIFAMVDDHHHGEPRLAVWCKAPPGVQEILVGADPKYYFRPPYVGPKGWVGARIDPPHDWSEIEDLVRQSYRMTAPPKVLAKLEEPSRETAPPAAKKAAKRAVGKKVSAKAKPSARTSRAK